MTIIIEYYMVLIIMSKSLNELNFHVVMATNSDNHTVQAYSIFCKCKIGHKRHLSDANLILRSNKINISTTLIE